MNGSFPISDCDVARDRTFRAEDAARGGELDGSYSVSNQEDIAEACRLASEAFDWFRETKPVERAVVLESCADVLDSPPYDSAASLFELASHSSIFLKLTPRIMADVVKERATPETFFARLVEAFGADRLAWGSNYPTSPGALREIKARAEDRTASQSASDREWIFGGTEHKIYPQLAAVSPKNSDGDVS